MSTENILEREIQYNQAGDRFREAIENRWPVGSMVEFLLSARQNTPTVGTVVGVRVGYLLVKNTLSKARRESRKVKRVSWNSIVTYKHERK